MCDTNCVLLPACREAFLLTTQCCFKRPFRKHTHFTVCMCSDNNYFTTAQPPKMALKVPGISSNKLSSGWFSWRMFFPQTSKTSFTFPSSAQKEPGEHRACLRQEVFIMALLGGNKSLLSSAAVKPQPLAAAP